LLARTSLSEARKKGKVTPGAFAADFVPITLNEVAFSYTSPQTVYEKIMMKTVKDPSKRPYMRGDDDVVPFEDGRVTNCSISFDQGLLVAMIGVPEEGKSTVMKLLGAEIIPDSGDLLIPPHLRALHVSPQPIFFNDTLLNNLTYGVGKDNNEDGSIERVVGICRLLGVSEHAVHYLDKENKSKSDVRADWGDVLNATERVLLNLARAFIANPEIVVVHKPTALLDDLTAAGTLNCMREFVSQKGLLMDPKTVDLRRPRTCIMTTARVEGMHAAHRIFRIKRNGVEEVSHEEETQVQEHDLQ
jgi:ABC-type multidrug transport system fused ATPase/permease subunit